MLSVNVVPVAEVAGLNAAAAPAGRPDAEKLTEPVKPFLSVTLTTSVPLLPGATITVADAGARVKPGTAADVTVNVMPVVSVRLPDVPVMVMG